MIIDLTSEVAAPVDHVWARIITPEGINDEMRPWMTMSLPRGAAGLTVDSIPIGVPVGRAWLRLFGIIPFDYDHLMIESLDPGRSFHEHSTMLSMQSWEHRRTLTPITETRTAVHDRVIFVPRWGLRPLTPVLGIVVRAFFVHRHRRLAQHVDRSGNAS